MGADEPAEVAAPIEKDYDADIASTKFNEVEVSFQPDHSRLSAPHVAPQVVALEITWSRFLFHEWVTRWIAVVQ